MADAMDSKSISREGVGVRVPSLVPADARGGSRGEGSAGGGDRLAAPLLPAVRHRIQTATQLLTALDSLVRTTGDASLLERRAGDLAAASETVRQLGYVVAVLACASGADLLLERREQRGLAYLCDATRDALRRDGLELCEPCAPLPALAPDAGRGWELPWAIAALLHASAGGAPGAAPQWGIAAAETGWSLEIRREPAAVPSALADRICALLPGARFESAPGSLRLALPSRWLRAGE